MTARFNVRLDGLDAALQRFSHAKPAVLRAAYRSVNNVADNGRADAAREIRARYMLPAAYINKHLRVWPRATSAKLEAVIRATQRGVLLSRYGAKQLTMSAKRAKGDPRRGIAAGRKQGGVSLQVLRSGGRMRIRKFFMMPLRSGLVDAGNGFGIAVRTGKGKNDYEILHSISVDQVFRFSRPNHTQRIQAALSLEFQRQLRYELGGV